MTLFAVIEYLSELKTTAPDGFDTDSLEVAIDCLSEASGVSLDNAEQKNAFSLSMRGLSLSQIIQDKLSLVPQDTFVSSMAETSPQFSPKFIEYMQKLREKGYFEGYEEGTEGFKQRVQKALGKWQAKFGTESLTTPEEPKGVQYTQEDKDRANILKQEGNTYLGQGLFEEAVWSYSKAIETYPEDAVFFSNRAAALMKLEKYQKAFDDCKKSIELDPFYTKAHYRLALCEQKLERREDALETLRKAITVDRQYNHGSMVDALQQLSTQIESEMNPKTQSAPGGFDLGSMMNNPMFQQMASQFMQDPSAMEGLMKGLGGGVSDPAASSIPEVPQGLEQLASSPQANEFANDPEVAAAIEDVKQNGMGAVMKYLGNPSLMAKLQNFMQNSGMF